MVAASTGWEVRACRVPRPRAWCPWLPRRGPRWRSGCAAPRAQRAWCGGRRSSGWPPTASRCAASRSRWALTATSCATGWIAFARRGWPAWRIVRGPGGRGLSPPEVALHVVRLACELPDHVGRSLSQWDCAELARQAERDGVVAHLAPQTVQRILAAARLKPWRSHYWLHPRGPRDAAFVRCTRAVATLLTRPLAPHEAVFSLDEKTSLQPRPRRHPTRPARPGRPRQVEHEYRRAGALHLFTALNTRSGWVYGRTAPRKRQIAYRALLADLDP